MHQVFRTCLDWLLKENFFYLAPKFRSIASAEYLLSEAHLMNSSAIKNSNDKYRQLCLRIHWRHLKILKTSIKSVSSNVFWYIEVCLFWKCIQDNIHWDKTQTLKNFPSDKINSAKNDLFFANSNSSQFCFYFEIITWAEAQGQSL